MSKHLTSTESLTAVRAETTDPDRPSELSADVDLSNVRWAEGDIKPALYRFGVQGSAAPCELAYDAEQGLSVDERGIPIIDL